MERTGWRGKKNKPGEVKVPVLEVFESFAHRVVFVLLIRQAMAKPFQVTCENFRLELAPVPMCVFVVCAGRGASPGRGSCFSFCRATACLPFSCLAWGADGWTMGLGPRVFPKVQRVDAEVLLPPPPCESSGALAVVFLPWVRNITDNYVCYCY